jgi:NAD(P)-dependent dehydrogenase (short-subunit alcohol dehydrogenase family)
MNIVITGSSSGIGKFLADSLTAVGHEVCRLARSPQTTGFNLRCDVADWHNLQTAAYNIKQKWKSADALICCAGIQQPIGPAMQTDPVAWRNNLAVNLDGTFFSIRAFYPLLQKSRRAKIVCFSGGGSTSPRPNFAAYGVAKTGVVRLVETLAAEWESQPMDINAIAPGAIFTQMTEQVLSRGEKLVGKKEFESASKLPRDNSEKLQKVLGLIQFLLSEKSDGITGRLIAAQWDPWEKLADLKSELGQDIYTLRRITPRDRGKDWGGE